MTATLTDRKQALLQAILESPEDDTPRLVLADVLDDLGENDRAEFIRVQIELAALRKSDKWIMPDPREFHATVARDGAMKRRAADLLAANRVTWTASLPRGFRCDKTQPLYGNQRMGETPCDLSYETANRKIVVRRGFVDEVTLSAADWLAHGGTLLAAQPVQTVRLTAMPALAVEHPEGQEAGEYKYSLDGSDFAIFGDLWGLENDEIVLRLLRAEWPRVRDWVLPG